MQCRKNNKFSSVFTHYNTHFNSADPEQLTAVRDLPGTFYSPEMDLFLSVEVQSNSKHSFNIESNTSIELSCSQLSASTFESTLDQCSTWFHFQCLVNTMSKTSAN